MKITAKTRISEILKHRPEALNLIADLSPKLAKLRNPILRKIMAPRATIEMACHISGLKPDDFFLALHKLGFEGENLGDFSLKITKAERNSQNVVVRFEVEDYWVEHYYNPNIFDDDLNSQVEEDKIKFLKDMANKFSEEKTILESEKIESLF